MHIRVVVEALYHREYFGLGGGVGEVGGKAQDANLESIQAII